MLGGCEVNQWNSVKLIQELADAFGPSGFEDDVLTVARSWSEGLGVIEEDHMRNLYIHRKENKGNRPILMLDAHSDEVGFMIHSIKPNGTLRFVTLGGWNANALSSADVLVRNADGKYMYVCRVDNTLVYANVDSEYKDAAIALIQAIGY